MRSVLGVHRKDWCWNWNSYFDHLMQRADLFGKTLMLGKVEGRRRRGRREWDGWMASPTQWTWVWVNSGSWWWTERPGMLWFMGPQRVGHDWVPELTDWWLSNFLDYSFGLLSRKPRFFLISIPTYFAFWLPKLLSWASQVAPVLKNLPANIWSDKRQWFNLGWGRPPGGDPLEECDEMNLQDDTL